MVESWLVDDNWVNDPETYNLKLGGFGGFDFINKNNLNNSGVRVNQDKGNKAGSERMKVLFKDETFKAEHINKCNEGRRKSSLLMYGDEREIYRTFKDRKHTGETRKKMSKAWGKKRIN